eukprot:CAMPEP_0179336980 /NCGR_PEP_ID=MMETSP0797-20121207/67360_1 /TAXON_ID=47934 /ORGANISM="Dinophysis acuminata, Strain DAEP01" /LENGTH=38 /DNA_ID= /DNA_START= /DNA_END= /DNA_ORIENTATION=
MGTKPNDKDEVGRRQARRLGSSAVPGSSPTGGNAETRY